MTVEVCFQYLFTVVSSAHEPKYLNLSNSTSMQTRGLILTNSGKYCRISIKYLMALT